jgi:trimethylamine--corrinoid protein Co-methyltransferase
MIETAPQDPPKRRGRGAAPTVMRKVNYRHLKNPFPPMKVFGDDRIEAMHEAALTVPESLGVRVLLPDARNHFTPGGAILQDDHMVHTGRDMVEAALASAPKSIHAHGAIADRDVILEPGSIVFQPGAGAPHATDLISGRRPGAASDFRDLTRLTQHFDVLQMVPPLVEPQDVAPNIRHYMTMEAQLTLSDKLPFFFARGTPQVEQSLEILRDFRGLSDDDLQNYVYAYTNINTNSPRQLDIPMAQGLIDFARAGQVSIVTPFTLMGAMAPITVAGAITLSHAEALAAITLTQLVRPGAPVLYGTFTSNVDIKSGAPAFGTPEHFKASLAAGQMARLIGLAWRSAAGSAANASDVQAAGETRFGLWGCLMAGATVTIHAAGWLEGGLTVSYEKLITDIEILQMVAELCAETPATDAEIGLDALAEVAPGGHFFAAQQTMSRYQTEFYQPFTADWSNFGAWTEKGDADATTRATAIWQRILHEEKGPEIDDARKGALDDYIRKATAAGGAEPVS